MYRVYVYVDSFGYILDDELNLRDFSYPYECLWYMNLDAIIDIIRSDSYLRCYDIIICDAETGERVAEGKGINICKIEK